MEYIDMMFMICANSTVQKRDTFGFGKLNYSIVLYLGRQMCATTVNDQLLVNVIILIEI